MSDLDEELKPTQPPVLPVKLIQSHVAFNLLEAVSELVLVLDPQGTIVEINSAGTLQLNSERSKLLGRNCFSLLPEDIARARRDKFNEAIRSKMPVRFEDERNGSWFLNNFFPVLDETGEVTHVTLFAMDISGQRQLERAIQIMLQTTSDLTGHEFFSKVVQELARLLDVAIAYIGKLLPDSKTVQTVAAFSNGNLRENFEYEIAGTPCETVIGNEIKCYPENVQELFPTDKLLADLQLESYIGAPLFGSNNEWLGVLVICDTKPLTRINISETLLQLFATRTGAELERDFALHKLTASEERLQMVLEGSQLAIWDWDINSGVISRNQRWTQLLDMPLEAMSGDLLQWETLVHPEDLPFVKKLLNAHLRGFIDRFMIEYRVQTSRGRWLWVHESGRVIRWDETGKPIRMAGILYDITDRKLAELQLQEKEQRYRELFNGMFNGFSLNEVICDEFGKPVDFRFVEVNPALAAMFGRPAEEIIGHTAKELSNSDDSWIELCGEVALTGVSQRIERFSPSMNFYLEMFLYSPKPGYFAAISYDISERKKAERALQASERKLRKVIDLVPHFIFAKNRAGNFILANNAVAEAFGTTVEELTGRTDADVNPHEQEVKHFNSDDLEVIDSGMAKLIPEETITDSTGKVRHLQTIKIPFDEEESGERAMLGVSIDITERKMLAEQLQQAQKMEAIGRLAGGVAHDFNNLLTVMEGHLGLSELQLDKPHALHEHLSEIRKAVASATQLTHQLLSFSRKRPAAPQIVQLNAQLADMELMLRRVIGEDVKLSFLKEPDLWNVYVNPNQLEQAIMNLAVNARDAMPSGGRLELETKNLIIPSQVKLPVNLEPGNYVQLSISDTGTGIPNDYVAHIFEPFFTTKSEGKGTGLGLSMVYGFIKQCSGDIGVDSSIGVGTTFYLFFPARLEELTTEVTAEITTPTKRTASGHILVVEDDDMVRKVTQTTLEAFGYRVVAAADGYDALEICGKMEKQFDVIVCDVKMPGLNGKETIEQIRQTWQNVKVLFASGYIAEIIGFEELFERNTAFLQKPFTAKELVGAVDKLLRS
ncbi:MAG: PAS domain S-box protein [bacterium]|nr:PAS domain S-box protein [bacterium]